MTNKEVKNIINTNYMADMANYADVLNFNNFFGKTPKDVIEIFGNYGEMVYSREEYLWKLSFLLSSEYSFRKESRYSEELKKKHVGAYHMTPTVDKDICIDTYRHVSKNSGRRTNKLVLQTE